MPKTTLDFEYKGKDYSLCFTVESLKRLEKNGFSFSNIGDRILTAAEDLFCAAFNARHPDTPRKLREEIYHEIASEDDDGNSLTEALITMVNETVESMKPQGNVKWRATRG
ncbi:MAG: DUF5055 domain-containing protein [Eubacteriales bacterium]